MDTITPILNDVPVVVVNEVPVVSDEPPVLNGTQTLIVDLFRKYKPELEFTIASGENNVPQIELQYGIVSNIPEGADPSTIISEPQKYKIPLDETAKWADIKKLIDIFEKYLKNVDLNKKPVIDASAQILILESMKEKVTDWNEAVQKLKPAQN